MDSNIIKKANVSADQQACRNVNTAISIEGVFNDVNTCHDAILAANEIGYSLDKFQTRAEGYRFVWNQETKLFALISDTNEVVFGEVNADNTKNWVISETYDETVPYQIYLKDGFEGVSVDATKGIDVGYNENLNVNYTGIQANVTIRTNKGILKVESTSGTINHYGVADTLNVIECGMASYHEFGTINTELNFQKGNFVLEPTGVIPAIVITATSASDVKVENKKSDPVYIYAEDAEIKNAVAVTGSSEKLDKLGKIAFEGSNYDTLSEVLSKCTSGQTVKLLANLTYGSDETISITTGTNIVIDLNGHSIEGKDSTGKEFSFITVKGGSLTVKDTSTAATGMITYTGGTPDTNWSYYTNTITVNSGTFTLESGIIKNETENGASYAVDISNSGATADAVFVMNGGEVYCDKGDQAVRISAQSTTYWGKFIMHGGVIKTGGFWLQYPGATAGGASEQNCLGSVEIDGGEVNGMIDVVCYQKDKFFVNISDDAVIKASKIRVRSEGNTPAGKNNVQKTDCYFNINCNTFTSENGFDNSSTNITEETVLKKLISISSTTTVSDNLEFLK